MLTKTRFAFDTQSILPLLDRVQWDAKNRCQLNTPTGNWLYDPYTIKSEWQGTVFQEILDQLAEDYPIGEARLIKLQPGTCYPSHTDVDDRLHINIVGNDQSYLIDLDHQTFYKTQSDNAVYYMDASNRHVAANFGSYDRIQLVIRVRLPRVYDQSFDLRTIKFIKVYDRFRYDFDNNISPIISNYIKQSKIGFFDVINDIEIKILTDQNVFEDVVAKIETINKDFEIV